MAHKVGQALFQRGQIFRAQLGFFNAAVHFQRPHRGRHHHRRRHKSRLPAFYIQKLLRAQIRAEARLCDGVVPQTQRHAGGQHGVAAVGDIGKGTAVDKGRGALQRLGKVWINGFLQKHGHGAHRLQIGGGYGLSGFCIGHHHAGKPRP